MEDANASFYRDKPNALYVNRDRLVGTDNVMQIDNVRRVLFMYRFLNSLYLLIASNSKLYLMWLKSFWVCNIMIFLVYTNEENVKRKEQENKMASDVFYFSTAFNICTNWKSTWIWASVECNARKNRKRTVFVEKVTVVWRLVYVGLI